METIWLSPTGLVTGDSTLQISYPFVSHPGTVVTCAAPGDLKWVSIGLPLPPNAKIENVIISYEVSSPRSFIAQIRLAEMTTPDHATVLHDDPTPLQSTSPASYASHVGGLPAEGAVTLELRLNFQNTGDEIRLGALGVTYHLPAARCVKSIAALKALGAGVVSCLTVLGYYAPGDSGGGNFYWDASATEIENGGTIIAPASNPATGRWKRIYSGPLNVRWFGAKGDGITSDRMAVQNAINTGAATNGGVIDVIFPLGKYVISGDGLETPPAATQLVLRGADEFTLGGSDKGSTTDYIPPSPGSRIWCNGVNGALLGFKSTLAAISIVGLDIDGANGTSSLSTTWTGLFPTPASKVNANNIRVSGCAIHSTSVQGARAIDLTNLTFGLVENCDISQFVNGYAIYLAGVLTSATAATLRKLYLHYNLECLFVGGSVSDCHVYDTVFESSLVALSVYDSQVSLNGCYFENIGYTEGQKTALTLQNPPDDVPVNTAMHFRYGTVALRSCVFQELSSSNLAVAWVRGVGMGSSLGAYGSVTFDGCRRATGLPDLFIAPPQENSYAFRVFDPSAVVVVGGTNPIGVQSYTDARFVTYGRINLFFASPFDVRPVKVQNGLFVYGQMPDNAYTGPLTAAPIGGRNIVGDRVINSVPTAGGSMGWVCVAAGSPGTWKAYAPIAT